MPFESDKAALTGGSGPLAGETPAMPDLSMALAGLGARFPSVLAHMNARIFVKDSQSRFVFVNQQLAHDLGIRPQDMLGRSYGDFLPAATAERLLATDRRILEQGQPLRGEEMMDLGTRQIWAEMSHVPLLRDNGEVAGVFSAFTDISDSKRIQGGLKASEARYRNLIENLGHGLAVHSADGSVLYMNKEAGRIIGVSSETMPGRPLSVARWQYFDEAGNPLAIDAIPPTRALKEGKAVSGVVGVERSDGTLFWVLVHAFPEFDENSKLLSVVSTFIDISDRKLHETELRLAASVFDSSHEAIIIADADYRVLSVNPGFVHTTGYSSEETVGQVMDFLTSDRLTDAVRLEAERSLKETGRWQGEVWIKRKSGEDYPTWLTIAWVRDKGGQLRHVVITHADISEIRRKDELIWQHSNYDMVTGLPNRRMFRERLEQELNKCGEQRRELTLLQIDLDRFKEINDTLGVGAGDEVLLEVSRRILRVLRDSDKVGRLGDDEFTVILPGLSDRTRIEQINQALLNELSRKYQVGDQIAYLTASIGVTLFPGDADSVEGLLKNADQAVHAAKQNGRNCFHYFSQQMQKATVLRTALARELRLALENQQLEVHFQPIINLGNGRMTKAEALLRWRHPQRGFIPPAEFIPIAEEIGLIVPIGDWVFREVARIARACRQFCGDRRAPFQFGLNKSPRQFMFGNAGSGWIGHLRNIGVPPSAIVIEVTEGLLLHNQADVKAKLTNLRDAGIQIALDDFGTGYSAMSYLKNFPIDYLKIDRSFVNDIHNDPSDRAIVEAIVVMAQKLELQVIAEGIETPEQLDFLVGIGCEFGQGWLFAKAMPESDFIRQLPQLTGLAA